MLICRILKSTPIVALLGGILFSTNTVMIEDFPVYSLPVISTDERKKIYNNGIQAMK